MENEYFKNELIEFITENPEPMLNDYKNSNENISNNQKYESSIYENIIINDKQEINNETILFDSELKEFKLDNIITNSCYFIEKEKFVYFFDQNSNIIYQEYLDKTNFNKDFSKRLDPLYKNLKKPHKIIQTYHIKMGKCVSFYDKYNNCFGEANFSSRNFDIDSIIDFSKNYKYKDYYGFDSEWIENNKDKIMLIDNYSAPWVPCLIL